ncbi:MAG: DUF2244 domain-containing protein [Acidiferrobacteraceae bacterium]
MHVFNIRPNRASWRLPQVLGVVSLLGFALVLWVAAASLGAWPILAFGLIELCGVAVVVRWVIRHGSDYERLAIDERNIRLTKSDGRVVVERELPTYWARVDYYSSGSWYPKRLWIRFRSTRIEVGAGMLDEQREVLAAAVRTALQMERSLTATRGTTSRHAG